MMGRWLRQFQRLFAPKSLRLQLLSRLLLIMSGLFILIGIFQYVIMSQFLYQNTATNIRNEIRNAPPHAWDQLLGGTQTSQTQTGQNQSRQNQSSQNQAGQNEAEQTQNSPDTGSTHGNQNRAGHPGNPGFGPTSNPFFSFNISSIAFIDTKGTFSALSGTPPTLTQKQYLATMSSQPEGGSYQIVRDSNGKSQLIVLQPVGTFGDGTIGLLQIGTSVSALQRVLVHQLLIFILLALLALILGLFTFLPVLRRTLVPLSQMVDTVSRINAGNLDERFEATHEQQEIELLSSSFNNMLDRLEASFEAEREAKEKMRRFVADASHELRTPLTSIHGFLEVLLRGAATKPDQLQKALHSMYGESERITKLVQDLLLLAQLDREPRLVLMKAELATVITEMEPQLRLLAGERHVVFSLASHTEMTYDRDKIKQVVLNLFQNAVQHTDPKTGEIDVNVSANEKVVELSVSDNGPGIPADKQAKVFERFYRLDASRSRSHGGAGLGLAISQSIVESHGGQITCTSKAGHGTTFTVKLPVEVPSESAGV